MVCFTAIQLKFRFGYDDALDVVGVHLVGGILGSLMVGLFAERLPEGFAFSDTAFRIFILMASRRLNSDRFFTTDFTPEVYSEPGLMQSVRPRLSAPFDSCTWPCSPICPLSSTPQKKPPYFLSHSTLLRKSTPCRTKGRYCSFKSGRRITIWAAILVLATATAWRVRRHPVVVLTLAVVTILVLVHTFVEVSPRYHASIVPLLCVLAGVTAARWWSRGDAVEPA